MASQAGGLLHGTVEPKIKVSFTHLWSTHHFYFTWSLSLYSVGLGSLLMFELLFIKLMLSLSLILTLFCHFFASSSFFFLASSSWEILEVSSANSVACMHKHTNGNRVKRAPCQRSLCSVCSCTVCRRQCLWVCVCVRAGICSYATLQIGLIAFLFN